MGTPALARRCDVRTKYVSHLHPSCGWVPGALPCIWTFVSSLNEIGFFSIVLTAALRARRTLPRGSRGVGETRRLAA